MARVEYLKTGAKIIKDFPLFGTGPDTVDIVFQNPKYGLGEIARKNVHLHNNFIQIAAERGIFAFLAWLTFLVTAFIALIKLLKRKENGVTAWAAGALASLTALTASGIFEYNFGDSEITMLLLFIITAPFALERIQRRERT
jgi:O-antigen ligase